MTEAIQRSKHNTAHETEYLPPGIIQGILIYIFLTKKFLNDLQLGIQMAKNKSGKKSNNKRGGSTKKNVATRLHIHLLARVKEI